MLRKKPSLKEKKLMVFIDEDLTSLRLTMTQMLREQPEVKNVTLRGREILMWVDGTKTRRWKLLTTRSKLELCVLTGKG